MESPLDPNQARLTSRRRFLKTLSTTAVLVGLGDPAASSGQAQTAANGELPKEQQDTVAAPAGHVESRIEIDVPPTTLKLALMNFDDGQDLMADRLFRTTSLREQTSLNGWWDFLTDPHDAGETERYFDKFPQPETQLWIPGSWNQEPQYLSYVGTAWYRRRFEWRQEGDLRLHFSAIFYRAKVWFDGHLLGEHDDAYLPCSFVVKNPGKGSHTVVVRVNNSLDETTLPKRGVDWFPFGGIDRPVYAERIPSVFIEGVNICTRSINGSAATLRATIRVQNTAGPGTQPLTLFVDGRSVATRHVQIRTGSHTIQFDFPVEQIRSWSPEEPNLYSARVVVGEDDQFTRFGIRTVAVSGAQILLNGRAIKIRGVNRHDDHPDWGSAVPPHLIRQDVEIIKRLGANAVRIHYPVANMVLDYCDQNGLLFLSEMPTWQFTPEQLANSAMQARMKHYFSAMVQRDAGHPCVLYWSIGNEWPEPDKSYEVIKDLVQYAHSVDELRPVTAVTAQAIPWRIHELLDIIGVNWAEYRWYDPGIALEAAARVKSQEDLRKVHADHPEKPIIITEFGAAESQEGWHSWGNAKWSEEYQTKNVSDSAQFALNETWLSGGCVWQFADARTAPERVLKGRLHGWNGKGIVDGYRSPKLAFYALEEIYREAARESEKSA